MPLLLAGACESVVERSWKQAGLAPGDPHPAELRAARWFEDQGNAVHARLVQVIRILPSKDVWKRVEVRHYGETRKETITIRPDRVLVREVETERVRPWRPEAKLLSLPVAAGCLLLTPVMVPFGVAMQVSGETIKGVPGLLLPVGFLFAAGWHLGDFLLFPVASDSLAYRRAWVEDRVTHRTRIVTAEYPPGEFSIPLVGVPVRFGLRDGTVTQEVRTGIDGEVRVRFPPERVAAAVLGDVLEVGEGGSWTTVPLLAGHPGDVLPATLSGSRYVDSWPPTPRDQAR